MVEGFESSMTLGQLMNEVERVAKSVPHDCPVIAEEDPKRGLAFDIAELVVLDGVVRVRLI